MLRFTRALFGLVQSPFLLGGTLEHHLSQFKERNPQIVKKNEQSLCVDDLINGVITINEGKDFKDGAVSIFDEAGFTLHKWHSNEPMLEELEMKAESYERTYAKEKFSKDTQTRMLGVPWNKEDDTIAVQLPNIETANTKRGVLKYLASIYDPLGLISPITLKGKSIFRDICDAKYSWDAPLQGGLLNRWHSYKNDLPDEVTVKRTLAPAREAIKSIDIHAFGDASKEGTAAAVYAVVYQESSVNQSLLAGKARLSKKTTIPRLELTAAHMTANMLYNIKELLAGVAVRKVIAQ